MKEEYFMQIRTTKKDEESGLLDKIVEAFDKKVEYYTGPDTIAMSMDAGMCLGYLKLSPLKEKDEKTKEDVTWYTFRITDIESGIDYKSLDELASKLQSSVTSKVGEAQVGRIYHVTATDVSEDFRMIRKQKVLW